MNTPTSLPTISRSLFFRSWTTTLIGASGRLPLMAVHVLPKSVVLNRYGLKSSLRNPFFDTNAVPASKVDAYTRLTQRSAGAPPVVNAGVTSVHAPPWFCVNWTLPSSVPTQMVPGLSGDSAIVVIVQNGTFLPVFSGSFVVRSGLISSHVSPWLSDRKRTWAPAYRI